MKKCFAFFFFFLLVFVSFSSAQLFRPFYPSVTERMTTLCQDTVTFSSLGLPIPDEDTAGLTNTQLLSLMGVSALGTDVRLLKVCFQISHTWVGDLVVSLTAPNGVTVHLMDQPGVPATTFGCGEDNVDVCIVLGTGNELENVCNPSPLAISGNFTAYNNTDLNLINMGGGSPNGNWSLKVRDLVSSDVGTLDGWYMIFETGPLAAWYPNPDTVCASSPPLNLNNFVTGTPGGTWSGTGVTGNFFNPAGLSGNIAVTYTVSASGCTASETHHIHVTPALPVCSFSVSLINLQATFINNTTGAVSYLWNFGDGQTSAQPSPVHQYASTGTYTVTLTAINACGSVTCSQNITVQACPDLIIDGGFESGFPSLGWMGYSLNFGYPFCNIFLCGTGGGSGAQSGNWWAWFGGINQFEEGYCSQQVTIPTNTSANLYFYLEVPVNCDSPADFLRLAMGTDTIFSIDGSSPLCGIVGYTLQSIPLSQYADGITRTLKFFSRIYGLNNQVTNFFVDNVVLLTCPVGIIEPELARSIAIRPNPAQIAVTVYLQGMTEDAWLEIHDLQGHLIYSAFLAKSPSLQHEVPIRGWAKGMYSLTLKNAHARITEKIVIQ
jgi:subtilisin-like proprotein convertase family protein